MTLAFLNEFVLICSSGIIFKISKKSAQVVPQGPQLRPRLRWFEQFLINFTDFALYLTSLGEVFEYAFTAV